MQGAYTVCTLHKTCFYTWKLLKVRILKKCKRNALRFQQISQVLFLFFRNRLQGGGHWQNIIFFHTISFLLFLLWPNTKVCAARQVTTACFSVSLKSVLILFLWCASGWAQRFVYAVNKNKVRDLYKQSFCCIVTCRVFHHLGSRFHVQGWLHAGDCSRNCCDMRYAEIACNMTSYCWHFR